MTSWKDSIPLSFYYIRWQLGPLYPWLKQYMSRDWYMMSNTSHIAYTNSNIPDTSSMNSSTSSIKHSIVSRLLKTPGTFYMNFCLSRFISNLYSIPRSFHMNVCLPRFISNLYSIPRLFHTNFHLPRFISNSSAFFFLQPSCSCTKGTHPLCLFHAGTS